MFRSTARSLSSSSEAEDGLAIDLMTGASKRKGSSKPRTKTIGVTVVVGLALITVILLFNREMILNSSSFPFASLSPTQAPQSNQGGVVSPLNHSVVYESYWRNKETIHRVLNQHLPLWEEDRVFQQEQQNHAVYNVQGYQRDGKREANKIRYLHEAVKEVDREWMPILSSLPIVSIEPHSSGLAEKVC